MEHAQAHCQIRTLRRNNTIIIKEGSNHGEKFKYPVTELTSQVNVENVSRGLHNCMSGYLEYVR